MNKTEINLEFENEILENLLPGSSDVLFVGSNGLPNFSRILGQYLTTFGDKTPWPVLFVILNATDFELQDINFWMK